jgi:hypothetical protein
VSGFSTPGNRNFLREHGLIQVFAQAGVGLHETARCPTRIAVMGLKYFARDPSPRW